MDVEIRTDVPGWTVAKMRHVGPYWQIGGTFDKLSAWITSEEITPAGPLLAIYHDDPSSTPQAELKSDACVIVDPAFSNTEVAIAKLPGGKYAVTTHVGPYATLGTTWNQFLSDFDGKFDDNRPCFELYVDDCSKVPPEQVRTELYQPIL
jgi:AraC family transcriptional regulator